MKKALERIVHFIQDEDGPTAVEYAVMLALIIAVCIIAIGSVGSATSNMFNDSANELANVIE